MKPILYAGAVLMTAASIYGFVDYKKSSRSLSTLYDTKETVTSPFDSPVDIPQKRATEKSVEQAKAEASVTKKLYRHKSEKEAKDEIKLKESDEASTVTELMKNDLPLENAVIHENSNGKKIAAGKKRKVNYKMYSRGGLDERFIEKEKQRSEPGTKATKKEE